MTVSTESSVNKFLNSIELPGTGCPLGDIGKIVSADLGDGQATVEIELGIPASSAHAAWQGAVADAVRTEFSAENVSVKLTTKIVALVDALGTLVRFLLLARSSI